MFRRIVVAMVTLSAPALQAQNVAEVQVAPPSVNIRVGERTGLLATAFDRIGNVIPTVRIIWSSNNINIAKVDNNGTVTGVGNGVAIIEARVGPRRGQAAVQVTGGAGPPPPPPPAAPPTAPPGGPPAPPAAPPGPDPFAGQPAGSGPAAALRLEPGVVYLLPSENTRVSPRALREDGSPAAPVIVTWTSLRADVASVDQSGNVVALSPGQGTIQATAAGGGGLTATAPIVVQQAEFTVREGATLLLSPGDVDTLHVIVAAQSNRIVNPLVLQWASSDQSVARVSLAGVVTTVGPGKATLTVSGLLQSKSIEVSVHPVVAKLSVRPTLREEVQVPLTGTAKFEAQALTVENVPVPEAPLRWTVTDPSIATFDPQTGTLTGRAVGKTQLMVRGPGSGLAVTWNISVIAGSIHFTQARMGIGLNQRRALHANFADDQGNVLGPAGGLTWTSDNPQVATVGEDGTVAGTGYGHAHITATAPGGKSAAADVFVVGEIVVASSRAGGTGKFQLYATERSNLAQLAKIGAAADTASASEPAFSPDGSRIAFVSQRDGNAEIYVMNADGSGATRLSNDPQADGHPVFTADGLTIVFHSARTAGKQQIWAINVDGSGTAQLTKDSVSFAPTVSPDGQTIAYVSSRNKDTDIWLMGRDGTNQRQFTRSPQQRESEPHFLRDGTLAYLVERRDGNRTVQQVMRADLATGAQTAITGTDLAITSFAVSPSGDLVALVVNADPGNRRNPTYKVYIQPVSSATPVPMPTTGTEQMMTPTFRP
ncbi:MAG TPA: Ig-like domain-containing protein [Gemmatimonadales bacterium]|jgi:uncharacterized protein YjdB|nr:Ig-like domain-containing protein [Gemmatimonadales bacterium]